MRLPAQIIPIKREENTGEENEEDLTLELGQEGSQDLPGIAEQWGQIWGDTGKEETELEERGCSQEQLQIRPDKFSESKMCGKGFFFLFSCQNISSRCLQKATCTLFQKAF